MARGPSGQRHGVGASIVRKEDDRHLRGRGQFVADIALRGTQEVVFLRSPHAHARIASISIPRTARGAVFTAAELPRIKPIRVVTQAPGARSPAVAAARHRQGALCRRGDRGLRRTDARRRRRPRRCRRRGLRAAASGGGRAHRANRQPSLCARLLRRQPVSGDGPSPAATSKPRRAPPRSPSAANFAPTGSPVRQWNAAACWRIATTASTRS